MLIPFPHSYIDAKLNTGLDGCSNFFSEKIKNTLGNAKTGILKGSTLDPKTISDSDLYRIYQIEQDAWAHGIGEYLQCDTCTKIMGKENIFGKLPNKIRKMTVSEIERILGEPKTICPCCNGSMTYIYGQSYISDIRERYNESDGYLAVLRDNNGEIQGFIDGYIDDFSTIYRREFLKYYNTCLSESDMKLLIEKTLGREMPENLLFWTSIALSEKYKSLKYIYELLKIFFNSMDSQDNITCISEARVGTNISKIYIKMGAQAVGLKTHIDPGLLLGKADNVENDIFVQGNIVQSYQKHLNMHAKDFWKICFR